jgi:hypothetical protein
MSKTGNYKKQIMKHYGSRLGVQTFTEYHIRVTDGELILDLFPTRYWRLQLDERGNINNKLEEIVEEYFNIKKDIYR